MDLKKPKLLIFEGIDKVGKTTLIGAVHKATGFKHLCIDRFAATSYAYGKLRERELDYQGYLQGMYYLLISFDVKLFFVTAREKIWWDRMKSSGDSSVELEEYDKLHSFFREFFGKVKRASLDFEVHMIDTTEDTVEESTKKIVEEIEK